MFGQEHKPCLVRAPYASVSVSLSARLQHSLQELRAIDELSA